MKQIDVALWELTKEEVKELPDTHQILIFNPLTKRYRVEYADKKCVARSRTAASCLKYFSFEEVNLNEKTNEVE